MGTSKRQEDQEGKQSIPSTEEDGKPCSRYPFPLQGKSSFFSKGQAEGFEDPEISPSFKGEYHPRASCWKMISTAKL